MTAAFAVGDIVCYKCSFLRSTGWYTGVPMNGKVTEVEAVAPWMGPPMVTVHWCDQQEPVRVLSVNLVKYDERHRDH